METVLITGATGFIGSAAVDRLVQHSELTPRAVVRRENHPLPVTVDVFQFGELSANTDWGTALQGVGVVVHAAARARVLKEDTANPLTEFRKTNVAGTLHLARQAITAGVKRFVFISSIGVNGNRNVCPFTEADIEAPIEPYAISKMEAEQSLRQLADDSVLTW